MGVLQELRPAELQAAKNSMHDPCQRKKLMKSTNEGVKGLDENREKLEFSIKFGA